MHGNGAYMEIEKGGWMLNKRKYNFYSFFPLKYKHTKLFRL